MVEEFDLGWSGKIFWTYCSRNTRFKCDRLLFELVQKSNHQISKGQKEKARIPRRSTSMRISAKTKGSTWKVVFFPRFHSMGQKVEQKGCIACLLLFFSRPRALSTICSMSALDGPNFDYFINRPVNGFKDENTLNTTLTSISTVSQV